MASWKDSRVTWAVTKLMEMAEAGDVNGVEKFNAKAYADWAKGSNDRKAELSKGYDTAIALALAKARRG